MGRFARLKQKKESASLRHKALRIAKNLPSAGQVHAPRPLDNIAVAFLQDPEVFFTPLIFPTVPVTKKSDTFYVWKRGDLNRDSARVVAPGSDYPVGVKRISDTSYDCKVYKYSEMVADEERENADNPLNLDQMAIFSCMNKHAIRRDREWATQFFKTGVWTGGVSVDPTPSTKFDDAAGNWITFLRPHIRALTKKGLRRRNITLTLPPEVFDKLIDHAVTLERLELMGSAVLDQPDEADLARILRIGRVIVGESVYTSSVEDAETDDANTVDSFTLATDDVLLSYAPDAPALNVPSGGYTFAWTGLGGAGATAKRLRREEKDADQIKTRSAFDQRLVSGECGVFVQNVLT